MCMYGINELVPPIYSGFPNSEHAHDLPSNADAARALPQRRRHAQLRAPDVRERRPRRRLLAGTPPQRRSEGAARRRRARPHRCGRRDVVPGQHGRDVQALVPAAELRPAPRRDGGHRHVHELRRSTNSSATRPPAIASSCASMAPSRRSRGAMACAPAARSSRNGPMLSLERQRPRDRRRDRCAGRRHRSASKRRPAPRCRSTASS